MTRYQYEIIFTILKCSLYLHCNCIYPTSIVLPSPIVSDKQINSISTEGEEEEEGELTSVSGEPLAGPAGQGGGGGGGAQQQLTSVHQAARHAGTQRLTQHIHCKSTD